MTFPEVLKIVAEEYSDITTEEEVKLVWKKFRQKIMDHLERHLPKEYENFGTVVLTEQGMKDAAREYKRIIDIANKGSIQRWRKKTGQDDWMNIRVVTYFDLC